MKPDASQDEIKAAFRRQASEWHPDRHEGDEARKEATARMASINKANAVLGDPERRARYDQTGDEKERQGPEAEAMQALVKFFTEALEREGNLVAYVRSRLEDARRGAADQIAQEKRKVDRLTRRRDKIKVKSGENLVHQLIDAQVSAATNMVTAVERALKVAEIASKLLDNYESSEEGKPRNPNDDLTVFMDEMFARGPFAGMGRSGRGFRGL